MAEHWPNDCFVRKGGEIYPTQMTLQILADQLDKMVELGRIYEREDRELERRRRERDTRDPHVLDRDR
ncbi:hypothetical protein [Nocardia suismassiliense]|uniref:hypothetical protein n=1 Tax=Nocardia suismassiliense TaxID=2077092 RepID=UPI000D1F57EE|nr:hypothetical protein [Nocardia suismassiliense]